MKKIIASASLAALGAASVHAANAPGLTPVETSKPWSVSATLRGFYDDNYATRPGDVARDSFGFEFSPSVSLNLPLDQTYIGLSYTYGLRYYEARTDNTADHSHQFTGKLNHAFTELHKLDLSESFVLAQEPQLIEPPGATTSPLRTDGDNIRNTASATFTAELTRLVSVVFGYSNHLYDYDKTGAGSYSALLDRLEHLGTLNLRWQAIPSTVFILGYQYGIVDYTSKDSLALFGPYVNPNVRNNNSHYVYVGADRYFTHKFNTSIRLGGQFTEYDNAPTGSPNDTASPYADANATWTYNPGSYVQLGIRHARNQTDIAFFGGGANPTLDQESTTVYGQLTHKITPKLKASLLGQFQDSSFKGGFADDKTDNYFTGGVNLSYQINPFLSAETGYAYDRLDSDLVGRSFTRNRIYIGLRATY